MIRMILITLLVLCASGCETVPVVSTPPREESAPVPSQCDASCKESCIPSAYPRWEGDPDDPATFDLLPDQVIAPLRGLVEQCDAKRKACVACLRRLDDAGLTCGTSRACAPTSADARNRTAGSEH